MPGNMTESTTPKMVGFAVMHETFDCDLFALQQSFGDQPFAADGCPGIALEHAFERQEELIEIGPMRQ